MTCIEYNSILPCGSNASRIFWTVAVWLGLCCIPGNALSAAEITFITHNASKQSYIDATGELRGKENAGVRALHIELVRAMMAEMKTPSRKIRNLPFKRGLMTVQSKANHAFFNMSRTPERERTVKWVGPIIVFQTYLYEASRRPTGIQKLEDARHMKLCVVRGNIHDSFLTMHGFTALHKVTSYDQCFYLVKNRGLDLTPSSTIQFVERVRAAQLSVHDFVKTPVMLFEKEGYIAFSRNISDREIDEWQGALDKIRQSGRLDQLAQRYLLPGNINNNYTVGRDPD